MARSTSAGSKPAASNTGGTPVKKALKKKKAAVVKKSTSTASRPTVTPAKPSARKRAPAKRSAKSARAAAAPTTATAAKGKKAASPSHVRSASPAKAAFGAKFLAQQQKSLLEERENYTRQADSLRAEADALVADFEPGDVQFDEESGEGDTLNAERERDLALSAQARQAVEEITHALEKFANGTYGICEVSGDPIPVERLEAIPWARERVEYKTGGLGRR